MSVRSLHCWISDLPAQPWARQRPSPVVIPRGHLLGTMYLVEGTGDSPLDDDDGSEPRASGSCWALSRRGGSGITDLGHFSPATGQVPPSRCLDGTSGESIQAGGVSDPQDESEAAREAVLRRTRSRAGAPAWWCSSQSLIGSYHDEQAVDRDVSLAAGLGCWVSGAPCLAGVVGRVVRVVRSGLLSSVNTSHWPCRRLLRMSLSRSLWLGCVVEVSIMGWSGMQVSSGW